MGRESHLKFPSLPVREETARSKRDRHDAEPTSRLVQGQVGFWKRSYRNNLRLLQISWHVDFYFVEDGTHVAAHLSGGLHLGKPYSVSTQGGRVPINMPATSSLLNKYDHGQKCGDGSVGPYVVDLAVHEYGHARTVAFSQMRCLIVQTDNTWVMCSSNQNSAYTCCWTCSGYLDTMDSGMPLSLKSVEVRSNVWAL